MAIYIWRGAEMSLPALDTSSELRQSVLQFAAGQNKGVKKSEDKALGIDFDKNGTIEENERIDADRNGRISDKELWNFFVEHQTRFPSRITVKTAYAMVRDFRRNFTWTAQETKKFFGLLSSIIKNCSISERLKFIRYALPKIRLHAFYLIRKNNFVSTQLALQWMASLDRKSFSPKYQSMIDQAKGLVKNDPLYTIQTNSKEKILFRRLLRYAPKTTTKKLSAALIADLKDYPIYTPKSPHKGLKKFVLSYAKTNLKKLRFLGIKSVRQLTPFQAAVLSIAIVQHHLKYRNASAEAADKTDSIADLFKFGYGICRHYSVAASAVFKILKSMQKPKNSRLVNSYFVYLHVENARGGRRIAHAVNLLLTQSSKNVWEVAAVEPRSILRTNYEKLKAGTEDKEMHSSYGSVLYLASRLLSEKHISIDEAIRVNNSYIKQSRDHQNIAFARYQIAEYHLLRVGHNLGLNYFHGAEQLVDYLDKLTSFGSIKYLQKLKPKLNNVRRELELARKQLELIAPNVGYINIQSTKLLSDIQRIEKIIPRISRCGSRSRIGLGVNPNFGILFALGKRYAQQRRIGGNLGLHIGDFKFIYQHGYNDNVFQGCGLVNNCKDDFRYHSDGIITNYSFYYWDRGDANFYVSAGFSYLYNSSNFGFGWEAGVGFNWKPSRKPAWVRFSISPEFKYSGIKFGDKTLHSLGFGLRIGADFDFTSRK
jgi:hypothetical protein